MPIATIVQDKKIENIDQLILDATNSFRFNHTRAKDKLMNAEEQLTRLAIDQGRKISEYPQYDNILIAWKYLGQYDHKYH
ncbi:MAG: hypothetical protein V1831_03390 [Candidatus Woesearchaeota archaeon]